MKSTPRLTNAEKSRSQWYTGLVTRKMRVAEDHLSVTPAARARAGVRCRATAPLARLKRMTVLLL